MHVRVIIQSSLFSISFILGARYINILSNSIDAGINNGITHTEILMVFYLPIYADLRMNANYKKNQPNTHVVRYSED